MNDNAMKWNSATRKCRDVVLLKQCDNINQSITLTCNSPITALNAVTENV